MLKKHGGNVYEIARQLGVDVDAIIDFSANINPLGYSARVKKMFTSIEQDIVNYPDQGAHGFVEALAEYHDVPADNILAGNGSTEFIHFFPGIIRPKSVLIVSPAFTEYEHSFHRAKGVVFHFRTQEKDGFKIQEKKLLDELRRGYSALYLCNPSCPAGVVTPAKTMKDIIITAHKKGSTVIVDETFMDYTEEHSVKALVGSVDNVYILRSMSKFFGMPGLRCGYIIAHPKAVERLREKLPSWSVNAVAQHAGAESVKDSGFIQKTITYNQDARTALVKEMKKLPFLTIFEGAANYVLLKLDDSAPVSVSRLQELLMEKHILIRKCDDFQGLGESWFRVAVKKKNENKKLVSELKKILSP